MDIDGVLVNHLCYFLSFETSEIVTTEHDLLSSFGMSAPVWLQTHTQAHTHNHTHKHTHITHIDTHTTHNHTHTMHTHKHTHNTHAHTQAHIPHTQTPPNQLFITRDRLLNFWAYCSGNSVISLPTGDCMWWPWWYIRLAARTLSDISVPIHHALVEHWWLPKTFR